MNMYTNVFGADVMFFFVDSQLCIHVRQDETPCACHQKELKKKKASTSISSEDGKNSRTRRRIAAIENHVRETLAAEGQTRRWFGYAVLV